MCLITGCTFGYVR